ncbi:MAG: galactonate dehydratase [Bacillota bacterium]|nr:galactonate dehydratase [Bacillota bacterium]
MAGNLSRPGPAGRVSAVRSYLVRPRWLFVEVETDAGLTGWGEAVLEGHAEAAAAAVQAAAEQILGLDAMNAEGVWELLFRARFYRGGPVLMSAMAGIDIALWDIRGRALGAPVWQLLGGRARERVRVYSWIGGDRPRDVASAARERQQAGFTAVKMNGTEELQYLDSYSKIDQMVERVMAVREACGPDFGIAVDFHGRVHRPLARIAARALDEARPLFIEEPVRSEDMEAFREVQRHCNSPIATGERLYTKQDFKRLLDYGGVDILQPDLAHAGGISEVRKIAALAAAHDLALAPHCPLGPIALMACIQIDTVCHNAVIQEQSMGIHYNEGRSVLDYVLNPEDFRFVDGYMAVPERPGLGVEVNRELVQAEAREPHRWRNPVWRHGDGSIAEW